MVNYFALGSVLLLCGAAFAVPVAERNQFDTWMSEHGKVYSSAEEYATRLEVYRSNLQLIAKLNAESNGAEFAPNQFADLTPAEFKRTILMPTRALPTLPKYKLAPAANVTAPASFNWVEKGAVTNVKNQGALGTCWAFSTAQNLEGQLFLKHQKLESLSVEQISECDNTNCGEFGGWPWTAFDYVKNAGGLITDAEMPYCEGIPLGSPGACDPCMPKGYNKTLCGNHDDLFCNHTYSNYSCPHVSSIAPAVKVSGWVAVDKDEMAMTAQLVQLGPLSVLLNAAMLQFYHKGIYDPPSIFCNPTGLDHAVLMVGYGSEGRKDYWTIKNSWGPKWGEEGYFRILRGSGKCGINQGVTCAQIV